MLAPDAQIVTLSGVRLAVELVDQGPIHVYAWDGERVTVGRVVVTDDQQLRIPYTVVLDDGSYFSCCPETMMLLRSGAPRYPEQLEPQESMLPLYLRLDRSGYLTYQEPGDWHNGALTESDKCRWRRVSRLVAEWKLDRRCKAGDVVSFLSKDRANCHPDNLLVTKKKRKKTQKKSSFAEHLFEAQRFIDRHNHKVKRVYLDSSRNLLSIRGLKTANLSVSGIFVSVDSE